jgi:hypothetical protein
VLSTRAKAAPAANTEVAMDKDFPYSNAGRGPGSPIANALIENGAAAEAASVIEQVRELLFGDHRRTTEGSVKGLEDRIAALTATMEARFSDLERRLTELKAETDAAREDSVEAIGAAIADLGDKIKGFHAKPKR